MGSCDQVTANGVWAEVVGQTYFQLKYTPQGSLLFLFPLTVEQDEALENGKAQTGRSGGFE